MSDFKIDTTNYLGLDHNTYKNKLLQISLTNASEYFKMRENVIRNVKNDAIKKMYEVFYKVMSDGKLISGKNAASRADNEPNVGDIDKVFKPAYPSQKITEFALGASKTLDAICEECIELIFPDDYRKIAESRLMRKGEADRLL